jgi:hypothetical protein
MLMLDRMGFLAALASAVARYHSCHATGSNTASHCIAAVGLWPKDKPFGKSNQIVNAVINFSDAKVNPVAAYFHMRILEEAAWNAYVEVRDAEKVRTDAQNAAEDLAEAQAG